MLLEVPLRDCTQNFVWLPFPSSAAAAGTAAAAAAATEAGLPRKTTETD